MKKGFKYFTREEYDYIARVAGKVPSPVIAKTLKRKDEAIRDFCGRHGISLRVPAEVLQKHWPEYAPGKKVAA